MPNSSSQLLNNREPCGASRKVRHAYACGTLMRTNGDNSALTPRICVACSHTLGGSAARWLSKRSQIIVVLLSGRSEEHTSELQSLMRISYAVFCLEKKNKIIQEMPPNN